MIVDARRSRLGGLSPARADCPLRGDPARGEEELEAHLAVNIIKPSAIANISGTLDFNVTSLAINATVASSDIGPIPPAGLKLFSAIFGPLCKGLVDKLLAGGIPLPALPPFELVDPIVTTYTGYLGIASNFKMVPASSYR